MKRTNFLTVTAVAGFLLAVMSQTGCSNNEIDLAVDPFSGKVVLNPVQGQVIKWNFPDPATKAHFHLIGPCGQGMDANPCTINVATGKYVYDCPGCLDPVVVVGSDSKRQMGTASTGATTPVAVSYQIAIACVNNTVAIDPNAVTASAGQGIEWIDVGPTPMNTWTVNFTTAICVSAVNQGQPICQITTTPATTYPYTVASTACTNPGNATVTVH